MQGKGDRRKAYMVFVQRIVPGIHESRVIPDLVLCELLSSHVGQRAKLPESSVSKNRKTRNGGAASQPHGADGVER